MLAVESLDISLACLVSVRQVSVGLNLNLAFENVDIRIADDLRKSGIPD